MIYPDAYSIEDLLQAGDFERLVASFDTCEDAVHALNGFALAEELNKKPHKRIHSQSAACAVYQEVLLLGKKNGFTYAETKAMLLCELAKELQYAHVEDLLSAANVVDSRSNWLIDQSLHRPGRFDREKLDVIGAVISEKVEKLLSTTGDRVAGTALFEGNGLTGKAIEHYFCNDISPKIKDVLDRVKDEENSLDERKKAIKLALAKLAAQVPFGINDSDIDIEKAWQAEYWAARFIFGVNGKGAYERFIKKDRRKILENPDLLKDSPELITAVFFDLSQESLSPDFYFACNALSEEREIVLPEIGGIKTLLAPTVDRRGASYSDYNLTLITTIADNRAIGSPEIELEELLTAEQIGRCVVITADRFLSRGITPNGFPAALRSRFFNLPLEVQQEILGLHNMSLDCLASEGRAAA